jgi:hypothetical protein
VKKHNPLFFFISKLRAEFPRIRHDMTAKNNYGYSLHERWSASSQEFGIYL